MTAKNVDSLRQKSGNGFVIRLLSTNNGLIDERWTTEIGLNKS